MNCYNFTGGIVSNQSPYLMKSDEALDLCNFDIEGGGLTVRAGTKKRYGPFLGEVVAIEKSLTVKGHEILFVKTQDSVEMVVGGVQCRQRLSVSEFRIVNVIDGFLYLIGQSPRRMKPLYRRMDGSVSMEGFWDGFAVLEQLDTDYTTDGDFPSDLYECNLVDTETNTLYYVKSHTTATKENIQSLLSTSAFYKIGTLGDVVALSHQTTTTQSLNLKKLYVAGNYYTVETVDDLAVLFEKAGDVQDTAVEAYRCPYLVWHPASMRYFAGGNPKNPTALYISEPNDIFTFYASNVLYPHLHLGKITGVTVVEKSVVVGYQHGWSHYVGSDPTEDGQWSLLSIPEGARFGQTICQTPGSVSFLSDSGLVSFSSSMLTVQMLYSPSSSLYKFLSKEKLSLPTPKKQAFAYYKNGICYLVIDHQMYCYHFSEGAWIRYEGMGCNCIGESYDGTLLFGCGAYITAFSKGKNSDFDPNLQTDVPISYQSIIPIVGVVNENEVARCEEVVVKARGMDKPANCHLKLSSERESKEGTLLHTNHLLFGNTTWNNRYRDSIFSETVFPWKVSGNLFFLELSGTTNPQATTPLSILNIYLKLKKERDKLC